MTARYRRHVVIIASGIFIFLIPLLLIGHFAPHKGFVERAVSAGVPMSLSSSGVSWTDFNNDGHLDLLSIGADHRFHLYQNNSDGTFTDITNGSGLETLPPNTVSGVFGDYNNDDCPDLFVTTGLNVTSPEHTPDMLYKNDCNGTFIEVSIDSGITISHHGSGAAWGDYDNDGHLDIYVPTYGSIDFMKSDTEWRLVGYTYESNVLYHNNGDGTFTDVARKLHVEGIPACPRQYAQIAQEEIHDRRERIPTERLKANWQAVWFDMDNDLDLDLYVSNEVKIGALYRNNGNGTFTDVTGQAGLCKVLSTHGVAVGDYDGNGFLDIYLSGSQRNLLWMNNGDGTFSDQTLAANVENTHSLAWGVGTFDAENDGDLDIYTVNGSTQNTTVGYSVASRADRLFLNDSTGHFTDGSGAYGIHGTDAKWSAAFGDYNNDGSTDAFVVAVSGFSDTTPHNRLYTGTPGRNHYLTVRLIGTQSNRDGVGATITAQTGTKEQIRQVMAGGSFLSQNSLRQTFGLGAARSVDTLTINWPSGIVQVLYDIPADQTITVTEE